MIDRTLRAEIEALRSADGKYLPGTLVEWAQKNKDSKLYRCFEWNDKLAARHYRIDQARQLIRVVLASPGTGQRDTVSLIIDRTNGGGYRRREDVMAAPALKRLMEDEVLQRLLTIRRSYSHLSVFDSIWIEIDRLTMRSGSEAA